MANYFALTLIEMGLSKLELIVIGTITIVFPILFIFTSKNLDSKGVFEWMIEKPKDWIGNDKGRN